LCGDYTALGGGEGPGYWRVRLLDAGEVEEGGGEQLPMVMPSMMMAFRMSLLMTSLCSGM